MHGKNKYQRRYVTTVVGAGRGAREVRAFVLVFFFGV